MGTDVLTFTSEDERNAALLELSNQDMPSGKDPDEWHQELEEKERQILAAKVGEGDQPASAPKADEQPQPQAESVPEPEPKPSEDDEELTFSIKRSQLPDILRNYKTPEQMLEQAAHARRYANEAEQKLATLAQERQQYAQQIQSLGEQAKEVETLKAKLDELQRNASTASAPAAQSQQAQDQVDDLAKAMEDLQKLEDDETVDAATLKKALGAATAQFQRATGSVANLQKTFERELAERDRRIAEAASKVDTWRQEDASRKKEEELRTRQENAVKALLNFQQKTPELRTSKKPFGHQEDSVERAVARFTDRLCDQPLNDWSMRNRILNGYLTEHPDVVQAMKAKGIAIADFGISDQDVRNWALLQRVYWRSQGKNIDPTTGQLVDMTNLMGQRVTFPDYSSAYNSLLDELKLRDKMHEQAVSEAEIRGQESLRRALSQRDTGILGKDGSSSPAGSSQPMQQGEAVAFINSANQSDFHEDMQRKILAGDNDGWTMYDKYNAALQSLGYPTQAPDPAWPPRESVRQQT